MDLTTTKRIRVLGVALLAALCALPALRGEEEAAAGGLSDADRAALVAMLEEGRAETETLAARAAGELFARRAVPERWSVAEVIEHITATEELLFGMMQGALAAPEDPEWQKVVESVPLDGFAAHIRDRSQPAQAPEALQPTGAQGREELLARFHANRETTLAFVRSTQAALERHTADFPIGKLTARHLLTLIANHNLRHNQQIAEVLTQLQAP